MGVYQIGEVIKRTRESLSITQEELSSGICSVRTLSRIETGKNTPNRTTFEALMEKMGKEGKRYLPFIRSNDIENYIRREEIEQLIHIHNYKQAEPKLLELKRNLNQEEPVNRQYILRIQALIDKNLNRINIIEERHQLAEALRCTIVDYKEGTIPNSFFSRQEILILCNIAGSYYEENNFQKSVELLRDLQNYFENVSIDIKERSKSERLVLSNLGQALWHYGEKEESLKVIEKAIPLAIMGDNAGSLSTLLYDLAYGERGLGKNEVCCKERLLEAYYVAEGCQHIELIKYIKEYAQRQYGVSFLKKLL